MCLESIWTHDLDIYAGPGWNVTISLETGFGTDIQEGNSK